MIKLKINLEKFVDDSYTIALGRGIMNKTVEETAASFSPSAIAVITDSNIKSICRDSLKNFEPGCPVFVFSYPAGEKSKNIKTVMNLFRALVKNKLDRKVLIFAMGGGVTGDIAGFLASIYLRGVKFVQIPTSLLAMVDSSIGGKTGVDTAEGKNLIGRFYQPGAVVIDTDFLATLPRIEFINGMAEVIKHSLIKDLSYFEFINLNRDKILSLDPGSLISLVETSCRIKSSVVEEDEKEKSLRQILNFGHTAGHAIERASAYEIPHGYAVGLGLVIESHISNGRKILAEADLEKITGMIGSYGLLKYAGSIKRFSARLLYNSAQTDKKNEKGGVYSVMLNGIGHVYSVGGKYSFPVSEDELEAGRKYLLNAAG